MGNADETRDFLTTRRAKLTPERAGLPTYGRSRRVAGLRREEVEREVETWRPRTDSNRRRQP